MKLIPSRDKIGICGDLTNQSAEVEVESRKWYSTQMDMAGRPWNFPELEATRLFLKFLEIEVEPDELWPELWTSRDDCRKANDWIPKNSHKIVLGIAPGVISVPGKRLPSEWFAKVVNLLKYRDIEIVLLGSRPDLSVCDGVANALKSSRLEIRLQNLAGKTSVRELIECIRCCNIVLSQETAALHIATALRKPVVGIIGGGHFGRFYPWGEPNVSRAVNKPMDCYGCNWRCKYESIRCIQEVSVESAAEEMNYLLQNFTLRSAASLVS
jgi:ADP-heptose:LPS heptosyltransferase